MRRLVGFAPSQLEAGAEASVTMAIDMRVLAGWKRLEWVLPKGHYAFALGSNAEDLGSPSVVHFQQKCWSGQAE